MPSLSDRSIHDGERLVAGELDTAIAAETDPLGHGLFLAAQSKTTSSRLSFSLGKLAAVERFTACHRYEPYWMKARTGTSIADVPPETQSLIVRRDDGRFVLVVPLYDESMRFFLRGRADGTLSLAGETGDALRASSGGLALYLAVGDDPFELCRRGAESVAKRLGSGRLRREKSYPPGLDEFGWCTWDAFYQEVSEDNVVRGLETLRAAGVPARFLILDDGWQETAQRPTGERRLTGFGANEKFPKGLAAFVERAKAEFGVRTFIVWHTIAGYWGGVDGEKLPGYGVVDRTRQFGEGVLLHAPSFNHEWWGNLVGFVPPENAARFFDDYHRALAAAGVDGVKVDSQALLEALAFGAGGRVAVTHAYRRALEGSVVKHFQGRLINCMSNAQETYYASRESTLLRTSIDFFPKWPESHGAHLRDNAQVGVWFGEFMQPDWDMFQSGHAFGAFHAAGRALSGGPVYVSDQPGTHDAEVLTRLVCSDGRVLRLDEPGRPTVDVLFSDPTREDVLWKIWNRAGGAGVVGVFNARVEKDGVPAPLLRGETGPSDVPELSGARFVCFRFVAQSLELVSQNERRGVELGERGYEIFTFVPLERGFAAIGLADKLCSHAAVESVGFRDGETVVVTLRDGGQFVAFSAKEPKSVEAFGAPVPFVHDGATGELRVRLAPAGRTELEIRL